MAWEISKDVLFQEVGGETVLLDLESEQYFGLDAVGTRIWQLIGEGAGRDEIVYTMLGEYDVDRATLETDICDLLTRLIEAGLVRPADQVTDA